MLHRLRGAKATAREEILQEKRGFLLCKEDRAILCRDGDVAIHSATAVTMKHWRFLLSGVRVSAAPIPSSPAVDSLHGSIIKDSSDSSGMATMGAATNSSNSIS
ncbi:salt tolerance-like protein [Musa troglodytarum]|uniref:Salt tolerance-like protein n=1 Tax=Musa troglodytarum TaxID=320322 RepID=A0A9E7HMJ4_9LILI|nr:salt tolerance-like protein [Musa troglodytarum]